jgi:membrane protein implicated in regulation of membrane protease activity
MAGLVGRTGVVVIAPAPGVLGEVELRIDGTRESFLATADTAIPVGDPVLVVDELGDRRVVVVPWTASPAG